MIAATLALLVLADIAPAPPISTPKRRPPAECSADHECVLSTFQGCCGSCCPGPPHAVRKGVDESQRCAIVDCAMPDCAAVRCMRAPDPIENFVAVCRAGRCQAVEKPVSPPVPPAAVCRANSECRVVLSAPAPGQCCGTPIAQSIDAPIPLQRRAPPPTGAKKKADDGPSFGLSTGDGNSGSAAPVCGPCAAPTGVNARCIAGQCVLAPIPPPG